jgi:hypothetical protein
MRVGWRERSVFVGGVQGAVGTAGVAQTAAEEAVALRQALKAGHGALQPIDARLLSFLLPRRPFFTLACCDAFLIIIMIFDFQIVPKNVIPREEKKEVRGRTTSSFARGFL